MTVHHGGRTMTVGTGLRCASSAPSVRPGSPAIAAGRVARQEET
jgi:hypothetical protein